MRSCLARRLAVAATAAMTATLAISSASPAATDADLLDRIELLEAALAAQAAALAETREEVERYRAEASAPPDALAARAGAVPPSSGAQSAAQSGARSAETSAAPASAPAAPPGPEQQPVGEAPATDDRLESVSSLYDVGGVLTPKGNLVFEPSIEYSHASANRFTFRGVELQEVVLIGVVEASDADRDLLSANAALRYGVTDRFELEARVPYIFREDELTFLIPVLGEDEALERTTSLSGSGLGDIEVAGHFQFNAGRDGWPIFVGNARVKTTTGTGPFEIDRDTFGVERELPTGSGFYEIEPSLTAILPTDPAVLFANVGYGFRIKDDVNERIGDFVVEEVDPGDAIKASVGMGFAINDEFSFSLGYKHSLLLETETTLFDPARDVRSTQNSSQLHVGSAIFGMSYELNDWVRVNLDFDFGVTDDAPDMRAALRVPIQLGGWF